MIILQGASFCRIISGDRKIFSKLDSLLSVKTATPWFSPAFKRGDWDGKYHFLTKSGSFPTGLLSMVIACLKKDDIPYEIKQGYTAASSTGPIPETYGPFTLREHDIRAIRACLEAERGLINYAGGAGKTVVECVLASTLIKANRNWKVLILTNLKTVFAQLLKTAEHSGRNIGMISQGHNDQDAEIIVGMSQSIISRWKQAKKNKKSLKEFKDFLSSINVLILDETQFAASKTWYSIIMACTAAQYRFGFSGTIRTGDPRKDMRIQAATGEEIARERSIPLIEKGVVAEPIIVMLDMTTPLRKNIEYQEFYNWAIVKNSKRNEVGIEIASKIPGTMIIIEQIEHGILIAQALENRGIPCCFVHGETPNEIREKAKKRFEAGEIQLVTSRVLCTGFDTKGVNCLVILSGGKAPVGTIQRVWRAVRKKSKSQDVKEHILVVDFIDRGKYIGKHSADRIRIYRTEGYKLVDGGSVKWFDRDDKTHLPQRIETLIEKYSIPRTPIGGKKQWYKRAR